MCPISQGVEAYCGVCDFNHNLKVCGTAAYVLEPTKVTPSELCWTQPTVVYRGMNFSFIGEKHF